jgi:hypothetical protein
MNWILFWIGGFATYRITVFIARDLGPFGLFKKLRENFYIGKWARCPFCVSPYSAVAVGALYALSGITIPFGEWICLLLAWSSITIALDRTFSSDVQN